MALGQIPPWLDVKPSDFVHAAQMGAEAGLQVARLNQAAREAADNRDQRANEANADRAFRQFEHEQQMQMKAEQVASERQQARDALDARMAYNLAQLGLRQGSVTDQQSRDEERQKQFDRVQSERERHNLQMEGGPNGTGSRPMTEFQKAEVAHWNRVNTPKPDSFDVQDRSKTLGRMAEIVRALDKNPPDDDRKRLVDEWVALRNKQTEIDKRHAAERMIPDPSMVPPAGPPNQIIPNNESAASPPLVTPTVSPGVRLQAPPAMPNISRAPFDPDNREAGTVYMTRKKGPALWNGKEWEPYIPGTPTEPTAQESDSSIPDPGADAVVNDAEPVDQSDPEDLLNQE